MDYLSQIYKDDCYRDYTDCDPPISLAVISSKELHIAEGLSHFFDSSACFRLNHFRNLQSLLTQKVKESLPSSVAEVFKSNWCTKHVKLRSSCVIFCLDWDELGDASMDELWLSEVCNQIKESMRRFRCRVIIVLATEKKMSKNVTSCAQIEKLQYEVKLFLGSEFKSVLPLFEDGLDRHSAENLFRMVVELSTKYHRDEAVRLKSFAVEPTFRAVRRMFKTGWHCLVLKDHKAAKRCFEVAYRTLKDIAPFFPATELRICGTILLHHILHIVSAEASVSSEELCYQLCEDHIIWVGQALRSSSAENKQMAGFLRLLLLGECYDWLAQNTSSMAVGVRQDFLVASLVAFGDALDMILNSLPSSLSVTIPAYVGSECCLETHRCVFSCDHADLLSKRVKSTLNQVLSQTELSVEAIFISARASQLICGGEEVFVLLEKLRSFSTGTYREAEAVHKLLMESTKNGIVALSERSRAEFLYSVVSLCFGPGDRKKQRHYLGLLLDTVKLAELDMVTLSYPRMGCCAPFTVLCSFANKRQDCLKAAQLKLTLFTTSVDTIIVDCLCVIVSRFSGDKRMNSITHSVSKKPLEVRLHAPCSVSVLLNLEEPGMYHCTCIRGRIKHGGTCLNVGWNMDDSPTGQCSLQRCEIVGEVLGVSQHNPWICVAKPACRVDMVAPNNIMGVEGEEVSVDIVLRTDQDLEGRNSLVLPFVPRLYEFSSHELLEKRSRLGDGPQKGYRTVILDNLPSLSPCNPLRLSVKYRCLKAGKYIAPILFQCRSANYSGRDVLKKVQMDIFYPFSPTYTLLKVLPWTVSSLKKDVLLGSEARLSVPERSDAFVRREVFTLVSPRDCINEDASTMQNNRDILLYSVHREITANRVDLNVPKGEEIVLVVSMECQAIRGLDVQALDVVCAHGTTLRSLNVGTLPCHVDYLEKLTLTAKICALRVGTYSPGFVRIVVVPEGGTQRIVSDLPLPDLRVEDAPLALAVKGPSTVILGSPFLVSFDVVNKTVDSRNCELVVGKCEDFFLMGGRTQWSFSLGPNSIKSTEIILQPLCVGTVTLPSVFVRLSSEMASGTLASCQCNSQRLRNNRVRRRAKRLVVHLLTMKGEKSDALVERAMSMGIDCDADTLEQLRQVPLLHLTQLMSTHLTDEKHVVSALLVLARATTGRDCLTDEEAVVILRFFTGKLTSLPNVEAAVESISLVVEDLSTQRSCTKMLFDVLSDGFLRNVGFQALPTKIRRCGYKIFMFMVTKKTMPWLATPFLRLLLNALDGESEPELVMHALDLQYLISRCVDKDVMEPLLEDYFDSLSSYFPVVFSQPPECPVTRDDLKRALTRCMTCPLYVDLCVSFLLSRLPSPSSVVKQESIEVFLELFSPNSRHSMDELKPHLLSVVSHVRNEVVRAVSVGCGDSDAFLQGCMKLLGFIAKRTHDTSYTSILSWLEPITSGTLASLNSGRVVCSAYATMLYHLASSDVCCSTSLARYFLPLLLMNVQQEIESDVDDSLLILSALLTGFFDLGNASGSLNGSIPKDVMRESLQVGSSGLFEFAEKKVLELLDRAEPPSVFIKCEFLSSLLSLAAYLCPWMPDEIVQVSCKRLVSICLCGDQNISEKVANCISRIGRVQGDILKDVLLNAIDDVEPGVTGVFALYQGLLSSSVSTAVTAMEILLIPSKTSFADRLPEANVFSLCLHGLSEHEDISGETALRLLTLLVQRDSVESFELICELLLRIPITLHGTTLLQMIDEKRWGILMTALLSCCESDILHVAESTEHWVAELLTGVCQKNLQCLAMQGVSALCARVPSVSDAFLERSKCCDPAAALALYAATARGLLVAGEVMNDKVEQITERLIGAVCEGIDADDALVATFFFPSHGSKRSISLLVPLTLSARKSGAPLPLKLIRILVLLIKKEASVLNFDWNGVLEICSKVARQERTEDIVVGIVELLDSIFSRIDSKIFFMRLLVMDGNLFHLIQSGVRSSALRTRCTSLSLLSQVALSAVQLSTQGSGDEYSHREEVMRLKGDVLHVVQPALNDHKRLARRAAAYCANQWYKLK